MRNKCEHCNETSAVIYNGIFLCETHHNRFNLKEQNTTPMRLVPKTALESSLKIKYTKLIEKCMLPKDYEALVIKFKKSLEQINNPIYITPNKAF
jgi:hypothetical protein